MKRTRATPALFEILVRGTYYVILIFALTLALITLGIPASQEFEYDLGRVDLLPITLGLQYHFVGESRWDPYIGAGVAWISASDIESDDLDVALGIDTVEIDDEVTWFANLGIGYRFGNQVGMAFDVRYMPYEPTSTSTVTGAEEELELTPLMASVGLRVRF